MHRFRDIRLFVVDRETSFRYTNLKCSLEAAEHRKRRRALRLDIRILLFPQFFTRTALIRRVTSLG